MKVEGTRLPSAVKEGLNADFLLWSAWLSVEYSYLYLLSSRSESCLSCLPTGWIYSSYVSFSSMLSCPFLNMKDGTTFHFWWLTGFWAPTDKLSIADLKSDLLKICWLEENIPRPCCHKEWISGPFRGQNSGVNPESWLDGKFWVCLVMGWVLKLPKVWGPLDKMERLEDPHGLGESLKTPGKDNNGDPFG